MESGNQLVPKKVSKLVLAYIAPQEPMLTAATITNGTMPQSSTKHRRSHHLQQQFWWPPWHPGSTSNQPKDSPGAREGHGHDQDDASKEETHPQASSSSATGCCRPRISLGQSEPLGDRRSSAIGGEEAKPPAWDVLRGGEPSPAAGKGAPLPQPPTAQGHHTREEAPCRHLPQNRCGLRRRILRWRRGDGKGEGAAAAGLSTGILTLPFALNLDRNKWPSELSNRLILELVVLSLGGVTVFQALMLDGMKKTSPAIASAMLNLAPGFIFVVAGCLRRTRARPSPAYGWRRGLRRGAVAQEQGDEGFGVSH
ncbi:hypothetical protein TRIUR3_12060 [Triticum urartu]|uniref:Uncharacterized protein n=1 Tax=Triticum urartu TaxID=4572 RepID=M8A7D2_TRIUA|nr:hypothetical protein TRIUR3_12060 [Triticum urartu]